MYLGTVSAYSAFVPFLVIAYLLAPRVLDLARDPSFTVAEHAKVKEGEDWTIVSQISQHHESQKQQQQQHGSGKAGERTNLNRRLLLLETLVLAFITLVSARHLFRFFLPTWIPPSPQYNSDWKYERFRQVVRAYNILSASSNERHYVEWKEDQQAIELLDRLNVGVAFIMTFSICHTAFYLIKTLTTEPEYKKETKGISVALSVEDCRKQIHRKLYQSLMKSLGCHVVAITYLLLHNFIAGKVLNTLETTMHTNEVFVTSLLLYVWILDRVTFAYSLYLVASFAMICNEIAQDNRAAANAIRQDLLLRFETVVNKREFKERLKVYIVLLAVYISLRFISDVNRFDPYEILQVSPDAEDLQREIKRAYRLLSRRYHWSYHGD